MTSPLNHYKSAINTLLNPIVRSILMLNKQLIIKYWLLIKYFCLLYFYLLYLINVLLPVILRRRLEVQPYSKQ